MESDRNHPKASARLFQKIWAWLLAFTAFEIFLAYEQLEIHLMLTMLLGLSVVKAALILAYFMHLRFERKAIFLMVVPSVVFCVCLMLILLFPDSLQLTHVIRY